MTDDDDDDDCNFRGRVPPPPPPSRAPRSMMAAAHASRFRPIVLCGPSGAGKSTLISRLRAEFPSAFGFSVSHTTRAPRAGEEDGVAYHFSTREVMEPAIAAGEFLESADVHGNLYGTSFAAIRSVADQGRACILDIDVQGVRSCRRAGFDVGAYIFISTPSVADLEARLRGRGTETEDKILKRVAAASGEITGASSMWWDAWIVNDELEVRLLRGEDLIARTTKRRTR